MKTRAKKGGEIAKNGEFYKGGSFLPSTRLPKQSPVTSSKSAYVVKPLNEWQLKNLLAAIEGTKKEIERLQSEGNQNAVDAHRSQLAYYERKLSINN